MTTDTDTFMDIFQEIIDGLKNRPTQTEVVAVIISNTGHGAQTTIFSRVPNDKIAWYKANLANVLLKITQEPFTEKPRENY